MVIPSIDTQTEWKKVADKIHSRAEKLGVGGLMDAFKENEWDVTKASVKSPEELKEDRARIARLLKL